METFPDNIYIFLDIQVSLYRFKIIIESMSRDLVLVFR